MFPLATYIDQYNKMRELWARGQTDDAFAVAAAGRQTAIEAGDRYTEIFFTLRMIQISIEQHDHEQAGELLADICESPDAANAIRQIESWHFVHQKPEHVEDLRAQTFDTLGRFLASRGAYREARIALETGLRKVRAQPSPYLSTGELMLRLGELLLDSGDFLALEELSRSALSHAETTTSPRLVAKWQLVRATLLHLRGSLSEANELLRGISEREPSLRLRALWQQANVLAALNRMDDCQRVLDQLSALPALAGHRELLNALVLSRRAIPLDLPATAKELLLPVATETPELPLPAESGGELSEGLFVKRRAERLLDEWTQRAHAVLLALYLDDIGAALFAVARLEVLLNGVDSPLLLARHDYLMALVACRAEDMAEAEQRAARCRAAFVGELALPIEAWAASRLLRFIMLERKSGSPAELQALLVEAQSLLAAVRVQLTPADDIAFLTNKPTVIDDTIAAACAELRGLDTTDPSAQGRAARDALCERILNLRRWHDHARLEDPLVDVPAEEARDVYAWVHKQLSKRQPSRAERWGSRRLKPKRLPKDAAMVVYLALPNALEVLLLSQQGLELLPPRPCPRQKLRDGVRDVLHKLRRHGVWPGSRSQEKALKDLAEILRIDEIVERLPSKRARLYICPDDAAVHAPWAALPFAEKPLVARLIPTLVMQTMWSGRRLVTPLRGLGIAVPQTTLRQKDGRPYPALLDTEAEIRALPGVTVMPKASAAELLSRLPRSGYAHIASHGEFDPATPLTSGLLLHEERLRVIDLAGRVLDGPDLVVMNACWSGDMQVLPGREILGLPLALLDSGVGTVIASQWQAVSATRTGQSSGELFAALYTKLRRSDPATALADAQYEAVSSLPIGLWGAYVAYQTGLIPHWPTRLLLRLRPYLPSWLLPQTI